MAIWENIIDPPIYYMGMGYCKICGGLKLAELKEQEKTCV